MKKRLLAVVLWSYAAWYLGATISQLAGLDDRLGLVLAVLAALIVARPPASVTRAAARPADRG